MSSRRFLLLNVAVLCLAFNATLRSADPPASSGAEKKFVIVAESITGRHPAKIPWGPDLTLLSALSAAGGPGEFPRSVTIVRGKEKLTFRIKKIEKNPASDPKLQPGDRIEAADP